MNLKSLFTKNIANIPGWRTKKKIVVIESDDWGSIRMSSKDEYNKLLNYGFPIDKSHYNKYDALEANQDLEMLFEVLCNFKDKNNMSPVFTAVTIVGNPDFEKIKETGFKSYYFEPFTETLKKYPEHNLVYALYQEGIKKRLFVPVFHGREHLNVLRWIRELQSENPSVLEAFKSRVTGLDSGMFGEKLPEFQAAFDIDLPEDFVYLEEILKDGLELFEQLFGYKSKYFVPTNGPFNNSLELTLSDKGVKYINTAKKQIEPLGNRQYKTNFRFLGKKNNLKQLYLTRNCFFEPSSMFHSVNKDWVNDCLKEIEIAFRWMKPAIISSHRVNYIGFLDPQNREKGLEQLEVLLEKMLRRWPEIEFMTSVELGDLISSSSDNGF